ncbi:MAG: site-specific integrase [Planctomycetota bacterium]
MPAPKNIPSLRLHKPSGRAVVTLTDVNTGRRKDHFLGEYGTPEAHHAYAEVLAAWIARGRVLDSSSTPTLTATHTHATTSIAALALAYVRHLEERGTSKDQLDCIRAALRVMRSTCGGMAVAEFGPLALQEVRQSMIALRYAKTKARPKGKRWTRSTINRRVQHVVRMFRWAVAHERAPTALPEALACVEPLKAGEFGVPEGKRVLPVPDADVDAIRGHVSNVVWAMVQVQRYTAARAGEVCAMRPIDLDTTGKVWLYRPGMHKNAHRGHERTIYLGRRAQAAIKPLLAGRAVDAYLFDPRESMAQRRAANATKGKPRRDDQQPSPTLTNRKTRDRFTTGNYRQAIHRACELAGVPKWSTHQLRHLAATKARKEFGAEAALLLGDRTTRMVDLYAERDVGAVMDVVRKIG